MEPPPRFQISDEDLEHWTPYLSDREELLWAGRPATGLNFAAKTVRMIRAGVTIMHFLIPHQGPIKKLTHSRKRFALTDQRAFIQWDWPESPVTSHPIEIWTDLKYVDGLEGGVFFLRIPVKTRLGLKIWMPIGITRVPESPEIYRLAMHLKAQHAMRQYVASKEKR